MTKNLFAAEPLPLELMFNNAPIEALCFENVSADEWTDISTCVPKEIEKLPAQPNDEWARDNIGYSYRYKADSSDAVSYSYYQYVGMMGGAPVILSYGSGGGTGEFTSLMSIERNGNKIRVLKGFSAGDRCNGGVVDAVINTWGTLTYGQKITPIDFLQIAEDNPHDVQPYADLEASATSCFGVAHFEDEKLTGVTLHDIPPDTTDTAMYKYQPCFNHLYRTLVQNGATVLSLTQLKEFTGEFNRACIK